ncbi:MAG: hypothetical protein QW423_00480 [Candidatus Aenigmatarchaeota archaeon]
MNNLNIFEISEVLSSAKRTLLLFLLNNQPMSYTQIERGFKKNEVKIGSSEIYKHLEVLLKHRYVAKRGKIYLVTLKGKKLVESLKSIEDVPPTIPRLEMVF